MSRGFPDAAYNPKTNVTAFQHDGIRVVARSNRIDIYGTATDEGIEEVLDMIITTIGRDRD